jgi:hypothetical protein
VIMKHTVICFEIFIFLKICEVSSLEITSLSLPSYSEEGQNLTFHCSYIIDRSKLAELDIKWYLGSSPSPFMVFLPHLQKEPQVVDIRFRERIVFSEVSIKKTFLLLNFP